jgi:hypothetical protein
MFAKINICDCKKNIHPMFHPEHPANRHGFPIDVLVEAFDNDDVMFYHMCSRFGILQSPAEVTALDQIPLTCTNVLFVLQKPNEMIQHYIDAQMGYNEIETYRVVDIQRLIRSQVCSLSVLSSADEVCTFIKKKSIEKRHQIISWFDGEDMLYDITPSFLGFPLQWNSTLKKMVILPTFFEQKQSQHGHIPYISLNPEGRTCNISIKIPSELLTKQERTAWVRFASWWKERVWKKIGSGKWGNIWALHTAIQDSKDSLTALKTQPLISSQAMRDCIFAWQEGAPVHIDLYNMYSFSESVISSCVAQLHRDGNAPMFLDIYGSFPLMIPGVRGAQMGLWMEYIPSLYPISDMLHKHRHVCPRVAHAWITQLLYGLSILEETYGIQHQDLWTCNIGLRGINLEHKYATRSLSIRDKHDHIHSSSFDLRGCVHRYEDLVIFDFGMASMSKNLGQTIGWIPKNEISIMNHLEKHTPGGWIPNTTVLQTYFGSPSLLCDYKQVSGRRTGTSEPCIGSPKYQDEDVKEEEKHFRTTRRSSTRTRIGYVQNMSRPKWAGTGGYVRRTNIVQFAALVQTFLSHIGNIKEDYISQQSTGCTCTHSSPKDMKYIRQIVCLWKEVQLCVRKNQNARIFKIWKFWCLLNTPDCEEEEKPLDTFGCEEEEKPLDTLDCDKKEKPLDTSGCDKKEHISKKKIVEDESVGIDIEKDRLFRSDVYSDAYLFDILAWKEKNKSYL